MKLSELGMILEVNQIGGGGVFVMIGSVESPAGAGRHNSLEPWGQG